jgi:SAM-dependent methyltransferase
MSSPAEVRNPFGSDQAARRYAGARPYYHRSALDLACSQQDLGHPRLALDVGCGTGLSARAAADVADGVVAVAERLPLGDAAAGLATVGAALHWFDQPRAFAELARVLTPSAVLVVYGDFFHGRLGGQPAFAAWRISSFFRFAIYSAAPVSDANPAAHRPDELPGSPT